MVHSRSTVPPSGDLSRIVSESRAKSQRLSLFLAIMYFANQEESA
jgi:hypothetical protein